MWEAYANYGEWIGDKGKGVAAAKIVVRCVGDEVVGAGVAFKTFILVPLRGALTTPRPSRRGARELITKPRPLAVIRNRRLNSVALLVALRSVQFSSGMRLFASQLHP